MYYYKCVFVQAVDGAKEQQEQKREANPIGTNDFDYEAEKKFQDSFQVYDGLQFNLASEHSRNPFTSHFMLALLHANILLYYYYYTGPFILWHQCLFF